MGDSGVRKKGGQEEKGDRLQSLQNLPECCSHDHKVAAGIITLELGCK